MVLLPTPDNPFRASADTCGNPGPDKFLLPELPTYFVSLLSAIKHRNRELLNCLARSQDPDVSRTAIMAAECIPEVPVYLQALMDPCEYGFPSNPQDRAHVLNWMWHDPAPGVQAFIKKAWLLMPKEARENCWYAARWTLS